MNRKLITAEQLATRCEEMRARGEKLVLTNGCFDLLHVGHVRYLTAARELGAALAVAINGDESVRALKGQGRPLNNEADRAEVIAGLECVDYVLIFSEMRATETLRLVRPAIYVKGGDYTPESLNEEEGVALKEIGAEVRILPFEQGYSTSSLLSQMKQPGKSC
jgi:rfaE bifunctional protein nucleotidyltransferase chain/domain